MKRFESDKVARLTALSNIKGRADVACGELALAEATRITGEVEGACVKHDILPGLLKYDLDCMRGLAEALAEFIVHDGPIVAVAA